MKKNSMFGKPSTTIAAVALTGLLAAGAFLAGCGSDPAPNGQTISNVAGTAQGKANAPEDLSKSPADLPLPKEGSPENTQPASEKPEDPQYICGYPLAEPGPSGGKEESPDSKIDITKCESYTSVPFQITDAKGNKLEVKVFPEWWGAGIYCTTGHSYAFEKEFQDPSKQPDPVSDHSRLTFDFGKYPPEEVKVVRDIDTYCSHISKPQGIDGILSDVAYDVTTDGQYVFEVDFDSYDTLYYLISAKWDESHNVHYAIAIRKV